MKIDNNTQLRLNDFLPLYNPTGRDEFTRDVNGLREFTRYTLDKEEDFPRNRGELMKHQKFVATFVNPRTPYDGLLMFHEMGSRDWRKKDRLLNER